MIEYLYLESILFDRDADETLTWIAEKDAVLSSDDYGKGIFWSFITDVVHFLYLFILKAYIVYKLS